MVKRYGQRFEGPYGEMLIFVSAFTALNNTKINENLTLHHMGKCFIS